MSGEEKGEENNHGYLARKGTPGQGKSREGGENVCERQEKREGDPVQSNRESDVRAVRKDGKKKGGKKK